MKLSNIKLAATLLSVTLLALPGCGGGSSPTPEAPAITISGVAATGAAFVDAVWALKGQPPAEARREIDHLISEAFKKGRPMRISFVRKSLSRSA